MRTPSKNKLSLVAALSMGFKRLLGFTLGAHLHERVERSEANRLAIETDDSIADVAKCNQFIVRIAAPGPAKIAF